MLGSEPTVFLGCSAEVRHVDTCIEFTDGAKVRHMPTLLGTLCSQMPVYRGTQECGLCLNHRRDWEAWGGGRDHTEAEENVAFLPQSPNCMKYWGSWPFSLVATVRKLLELLSQCPFCKVENFKKSLLRNGCGIFIQMNQTSTHHLPVLSLGHTQSPALLWDLPKDTPAPPPGSISHKCPDLTQRKLQ